MQNELRPCPFCSSDMSDFAGMFPESFGRCSDGTFSVCCSECLTLGPNSLTMELAISAWNERAAAPSWQPMETAPKDRKIVIDVSYWYHDDKTITSCFDIANWNSLFKKWDTGDGLRRTDQIHAWMDIPASTLPMPQPEGEDK